MTTDTENAAAAVIKRLNVNDLVAVSSGAAIGTLALSALGAIFAAPVVVPIIGAVLGGAVGLGARKIGSRQPSSDAAPTPGSKG
jgi:hypothetical protein